MSNGKITFIGLGLYDAMDISEKGINEAKISDEVFAEFFTAKLTGSDLQDIENKIGKKIKVLSREEVENGDIILKSASQKNIALLICGDPMVATTHIDLRIRAVEKGIETNVIHGSSIITAVPGLLGLQHYKFGRITTIAYPEKEYFPTSPYDVIEKNKKMDLHTLILLDIQSDKERYMTANEGIEFLLKIEEIHKRNIFNEKSLICVVARAGSEKPFVCAGEAGVLKNQDFGPPLHSMVIPGKMHFMEIEALSKLANLPMNICKKLQKL
jgi:diphthine synthase